MGFHVLSSYLLLNAKILWKHCKDKVPTFTCISLTLLFNLHLRLHMVDWFFLFLLPSNLVMAAIRTSWKEIHFALFHCNMKDQWPGEVLCLRSERVPLSRVQPVVLLLPSLSLYSILSVFLEMSCYLTLSYYGFRCWQILCYFFSFHCTHSMNVGTGCLRM